jgi:hypothetical protein
MPGFFPQPMSRSCRRVDELDRTINFAFNGLPPEQEDIPDRDQRIAATILVQSLVISVQGRVDNLAWIWVYEIGLKGPNGKEIKRSWVCVAACRPFTKPRRHRRSVSWGTVMSSADLGSVFSVALTLADAEEYSKDLRARGGPWPRGNGEEPCRLWPQGGADRAHLTRCANKEYGGRGVRAVEIDPVRSPPTCKSQSKCRESSR